MNIKTPSSGSAVSRGRGGRTSTAHDHHDDASSTAAPNLTSAGTGPVSAHQLPTSNEDDEMPLARVRDTAIALKACVSPCLTHKFALHCFFI